MKDSRKLALIGHNLAIQKSLRFFGLLKLTMKLWEQLENNLASRRVLEKVGYVDEGCLREQFLVNGLPANEIFYGILRRELKTLQNKG
jgi:RimJ/RimL family protein N-acetyltransferase